MWKNWAENYPLYRTSSSARLLAVELTGNTISTKHTSTSICQKTRPLREAATTVRGRCKRILHGNIAAVLAPPLGGRTPAPRIAPASLDPTVAPTCTLLLVLLLFSLAVDPAAIAISVAVGPPPPPPGVHDETVLGVQTAGCLSEFGVPFLQLSKPLGGHLFSARSRLPPHLLGDGGSTK